MYIYKAYNPYTCIEIHVYVHIQGCGNSEPTAGHFDQHVFLSRSV